MSAPRRAALRSATNTSSPGNSTEPLPATTPRAGKRAAPSTRDAAKPPPAKAAKKCAPKTIDEDVIVISSDSEDDRRVIAARNASRDKSLLQENERLQRLVQQLLEQQDKGKKRARDQDDEADATQLRTKAAKFEAEVERLKGKLDASEKEVKQLQQVQGKNVDVEGLREFFECEICMETLWQPWALSDCGHTFCQTCLISLFNDQKFACPTCRVQVRRRPIEVYAFKSMIRAVAGPAPPEVDMFADSQHIWDPLWPRVVANAPLGGHR